MFTEVFDPRHNSLNAIRLLLATTVIVWHSFPLTGHDIGSAPLRQALSNIPVDAFFAISGFLICMSWSRHPNVRSFLSARVRRIFPAFWVCLLVTALVFAPLASHTFGLSNLTYITSNSLLYVAQTGIDTTLTDVPFEGVWNGSMWTLSWEFACYLGVLLLGVLGALPRRWVLPALFIAATAASAVCTWGGVDNALIVLASRFGVMFLAGATIWRLQDRVPVSWPLAAVGVAVTAAALFLPNYRVLAALPVAYLVLTLGAVVRKPALRTDISYGMYVYAFPVQQIVASAAVTDVGAFMLVSIVLTLPFAWMSWVLVERPLLQRKKAPTRTTVKVGEPGLP